MNEQAGSASTAALHPGLFRSIVETTNDVVIVTDAALDPPGPTILYVNPAFTRLTGYEAHEALGKSPRILQGPGTGRTALDAIREELRTGHQVHEKVLNYAKSGAPYWLDLKIFPLRNDSGTIVQFAAIERDVTLDKRRLDELAFAADRDTLTGIPNRRSFIRMTEAELKDSRLSESRGPCLAFIDIDHFKRVNDEFGHAVGDAVICGVADRLANNVRRMDVLGRIGGEEFAVCMSLLTLREADAIGERLRYAVASHPVDTPIGPLSVTVSVGLSEASPTEHSLPDVMARADQAMYSAKRAGRDRVATHPTLSVAS